MYDKFYMKSFKSKNENNSNFNFRNSSYSIIQ